MILRLLILVSLIYVFSCSGTVDPLPDNCTSSDLSLVAGNINAESGCGTSDASFSVTGSGGELPYQYKIDNENFTSDASFTGKSAGIYVVTVMDAKGCTFSIDVNIPSVAGVSITSVQTTTSGCGTSNGSILIEASGSGAVEYRLGNGPFVSSGIFEGLGAGIYAITAKDATGCSITTNTTIKTGIPFATVKEVINQNCAVSGCHVAGTGRTDYSKDENIKNNASAIEIRTGNGSMPPPGRPDLTQEQINQIACWVDDGAIL